MCSCIIDLFHSSNYTEIVFDGYLEFNKVMCTAGRSAIGYSHEPLLVYRLHTIVDWQPLRSLRPLDGPVDQFCHSRDHVVHRSDKLHGRVTFPTKAYESAIRHQRRSTREVDEKASPVPRARRRSTPRRLRMHLKIFNSTRERRLTAASPSDFARLTEYV